MKRVLFLLSMFIAIPAFSQVIVGNFGIQYVASAPSGGCSSNAAMQVVVGFGKRVYVPERKLGTGRHRFRGRLPDHAREHIDWCELDNDLGGRADCKRSESDHRWIFDHVSEWRRQLYNSIGWRRRYHHQP